MLKQDCLLFNYRFTDYAIGEDPNDEKGEKITTKIRLQDHDNLKNFLYNYADFDKCLTNEEKAEIDQVVCDLFDKYAILDNVFRLNERLIMNSGYKDDRRLYLYFMFKTNNYEMNTTLKFLNHICDMDYLHSFSGINYMKYRFLCCKMSQYLNEKEFDKKIERFSEEKEFVYVKSIEFIDLAYGENGYDLDENDFYMRICLVGSK